MQACRLNNFSRGGKHAYYYGGAFCDGAAEVEKEVVER